MIKKKIAAFTLIEVLLALGILALVMSVSLKIFSSNAINVSKLEQKAMSRFVADNILSTTVYEEELSFERGSDLQAGMEYFWERKVTFIEDGKSVQIDITVSSQQGLELYKLQGYKVLR